MQSCICFVAYQITSYHRHPRRGGRNLCDHKGHLAPSPSPIQMCESRLCHLLNHLVMRASPSVQASWATFWHQHYENLILFVEPWWTWLAASRAFSEPLLGFFFFYLISTWGCELWLSVQSGTKSTTDFKECSLHAKYHKVAEAMLIGCIWTTTTFKPSKTIKAENDQLGLKGSKG